jgi:hypothetical protein
LLATRKGYDCTADIPIAQQHSSNLTSEITKSSAGPQPAQSARATSTEPITEAQALAGGIAEDTTPTINHLQKDGITGMKASAPGNLALTDSQIDDALGEQELDSDPTTFRVADHRFASLEMVIGGKGTNIPELGKLDLTCSSEEVVSKDLNLQHVVVKDENSTSGSAVNRSSDVRLIEHLEQPTSLNSLNAAFNDEPLRDATNRPPNLAEHSQKSGRLSPVPGLSQTYLWEQARSSLLAEQHRPRLLRKPGIIRSETAGALDMQQAGQTSITASKTCGPEDLTGRPRAWAMKQNPSPLKDRIGLFKALSRHETETEPSESSKG